MAMIFQSGMWQMSIYYKLTWKNCKSSKKIGNFVQLLDLKFLHFMRKAFDAQVVFLGRGHQPLGL